jgi:hypothetical protein
MYGIFASGDPRGVPTAQTRTEINRQLVEDLQNGRVARFCETVNDVVAPKIVNYLYRQAKGALSFEDCEDCWNEAFDKCLKILSGMRSGDNGAGGSINFPVAYLYRAGKNALADMLTDHQKETDGNARLSEALRPGRGRRKRPQSDAGDGEAAGEWVDLDPDAATILAEEIVEFEAENSIAVQAVRLAVRHLSPVLRKTAEHMLTYGCDHPSTDPPLGMSPAAYRKNKERALAALDPLIRKAYEELGQCLPGPPSAEFEEPETSSEDVTE